MGLFCSDLKHRQELHDLRYAVQVQEVVDDNELSDGDSRSIVTVSEESSAPSVKRVPLSALHRRVYRDEKKKREIFFDLDSVDEANEVAEKAFSDITSVRYKPTNRSLLTKANLSIRERMSAPSQGMLSQNAWWNNARPPSVCSDQAGWNSRRPRSTGRSLLVYKTARSSGYTETGSAKFAPGYSTDERSFNTSLDLNEKSDSGSDSLKYPRKQAEAKDSLKFEFHKNQMVDIINRVKPSSLNTNETDQTSPYSSHNRLHRAEERKEASQRCNSNIASNHDFRQPHEVLMLIDDNTVGNAVSQRSELEVAEIEKENEDDVGLIFKTLEGEDVLSEGWSKTDHVPGNNEHVALP